MCDAVANENRLKGDTLYTLRAILTTPNSRIQCVTSDKIISNASKIIFRTTIYFILKKKMLSIHNFLSIL